MPEFYVEALTDRWTCFKCNKTGKKKFLKCAGCEAITYCSVECQVVDWPRHEWNCVPVMVTEIPGKGRGLVAARDIKMGELIFKEKPSITLSFHPADPAFMQSLKDQVGNLPVEAKAQFYKLKPKTFDDVAGIPALRSIYQTVASNTSQIDFKVFSLCFGNFETEKNSPDPVPKSFLNLNLALVNHSCAPNAAQGFLEEEENSIELRAIKDISKNEEVCTCYFRDVKQFGSIQRKRKTGFRKEMGFDCKCSVCLGKVPCQEKVLKKLIELHNKLDPSPSSDWKRDARIRDKIVDLTLQLYMGQPWEKHQALGKLAISAHKAEEQVLAKKALDQLKQLSEDTKLEEDQTLYDKLWLQLKSDSVD